MIRDLSPVSGEIYAAHRGAIATWPRLQPLINHEALSVARARCEHYDTLDLWLDNSTLNISQPCLADVVSDVFRVDPGIAKMMLGLNGASWLARIRRLAIGPFELGGHFDVMSILRILQHTRDLDEVYILLPPEAINWRTCDQHHDMHARRRKNGFSLIEVSAEGPFDSKMRELGSPPSDGAFVAGDSDCAATLSSIVYELGRKCSKAKITYGCLDI